MYNNSTVIKLILDLAKQTILDFTRPPPPFCLTKNRDAGSRPRRGRVVRVLEATWGGGRSNERNEERQLAARDAHLVIFPSPVHLAISPTRGIDSPIRYAATTTSLAFFPVFSDTLPIAPRDIPAADRARTYCSTHRALGNCLCNYAAGGEWPYARIRTRQLVPSIAERFN